MATEAFSTARLARLHAVLAGYVERQELPGLVALVSRGDQVHVEALGTLAQGSRAPMRRDTIFRISSMTKPLTAAAAMVLVEDCKLRLDDPVDQFLPELASPEVLVRADGPVTETVAARRPITLRDLLTFCMGSGMLAPPGAYPILRALAEQGFQPGPPQPAHAPNPDEWLRRFSKLPLMYQPGERWVYHTSAEVLGVLIARAAGRSLESFMRERIFEPLGMKDTAFSVPADKLDRFAASYLTHPDTGELTLFDAAVGGQWSKPPVFEAGADGLVSTLDDYYAFSRMMLSKGVLGKERVLSRFSVELMTTDQLTPRQKPLSVLLDAEPETFGFGFGMSVILRREQIWETPGQFGWDGGLGTCWRADPREDVTTILLTQQAWTSPKFPKISVDFWTSAYQAIEG